MYKTREIDKELHKENLIKLINTRLPDEHIVPLFVKIDNHYYMLSELDEIDRYSRSTFRLVFGAKMELSIIDKDSFPSNLMSQYNIEDSFEVEDPDTMFITKYITFSVYDDGTTNNPIDEEIHKYYDLITSYVEKVCYEKRQQKLKELMLMEEAE